MIKADKLHKVTAGSNPDFIFVNPQLGENIGAAARGLLNFGFNRMILVNPREGWLTAQAVARASGASSLLNNARICPDLESAVADYSYVFAATARKRGLKKPVISPESAMHKADRILGLNEPVAFLFGPERTGLTNRDIMFANDYVSIATNPDFSSINLAHCAVLFAYEWSKIRDRQEGEHDQPQENFLASVVSKKTLAEYFISDLKRVDYFTPQNRIRYMEEYLMNLFLRLDLTMGEVKTFHRIRKALTRPPASKE